MSKLAAVFGLLLVAILVLPTASVAVEAVGQRHGIPCFQCGPDAPESIHIARSTGAAAVVLQTNIYDANGILVGTFTIADPAGTFLTQQIVFTTTGALASASPAPLPAGLYSAVLFASPLTDIFYEQAAVNAGGVAGILTGRGDLYNYLGVSRALTLYPEVSGGAPTGLVNFFVCNNPANNMATFLGIPSPAVGAQAVAQIFTPAGNMVFANFLTQSTFARPLVQLSAAGVSGGSLFISAPGATRMSCVKFVRIGTTVSVGSYTY